MEYRRIYDILERFLGTSRQGSYMEGTTQYQFNCPVCADDNGGIPDNKYNLEISLSKLQYHCWKCESSGSLSKLIRTYGGRLFLAEFNEVLKELRTSALYSLDSGITEAITPQLEKLHLPKSFKKIDLQHCADKRVVRYALSRGLDQKIIDKHNLGYCPWEEEDKKWSCRIIIPSYDEFGELNYYVGRDYLPEKKDAMFFRPKYKNCDNDKKQIVFQESTIDWDADVYLVEGALDCLYCPNCIALLGKSLSSDSILFSTLMEKCTASVVICLDADTKIEETKKIYQLLNFGNLYGKVKYIRLDRYKDFGEIFEKYGRSGIVAALKTAKQFKETDLL